MLWIDTGKTTQQNTSLNRGKTRGKKQWESNRIYMKIYTVRKSLAAQLGDDIHISSQKEKKIKELIENTNIKAAYQKKRP